MKDENVINLDELAQKAYELSLTFTNEFKNEALSTLKYTPSNSTVTDITSFLMSSALKEFSSILKKDDGVDFKLKFDIIKNISENQYFSISSREFIQKVKKEWEKVLINIGDKINTDLNTHFSHSSNELFSKAYFTNGQIQHTRGGYNIVINLYKDKAISNVDLHEMIESYYDDFLKNTLNYFGQQNLNDIKSHVIKMIDEINTNICFITPSLNSDNILQIKNQKNQDELSVKHSSQSKVNIKK